MQFHRFRIAVTLMAALAGAVAYLCRLNLSLVIEEMVVKDGCDLAPTNALECSLVPDEVASLASKDLIKPRTEEQAIAQLSLGAWWVRRRTNTRLMWLAREKMRRQQQPLEALTGGDQIMPLTIDVSRGHQQLQQHRIISALAINTNSNGNSDYNQRSNVNDSTDEVVRVAMNTNDGRELATTLQQNLLSWSDSERNQLLGAFFWGYVIFQIPCGRAAEIFGAKALFMWLAVGTGGGSLLFPYAAKSFDTPYVAWCIRFIMGASQAGLFPAVYVLLCEWLPKKERSKWLTVPSATSRLGTIVMNLVIPYVFENYGWEMVFESCGAVTLLWALFFVTFGSDSPQTNRWISQKELRYIEARMGRLPPRVGSIVSSQQQLNIVTGSSLSINEATSESGKQQQKKPPLNWAKLITSKPLLVLAVVMFTSEWSNMLLLIKLPAFLGLALGMDMKTIGMWSSILVGVYCIQFPLSGYLASKMEPFFADSLQVRKLFEFAAHSIQAACCVTVALVSEPTIVIIALTVMMIGRSTVGGGQCMMPPELSTDYPGTVMALANSLANVAGIIGPMTVDWMVFEQTRYESWQSLWLLSAAIFVVGGLIFCLLADNSPQNYGKKSKKGPKNGLNGSPLDSGIGIKGTKAGEFGGGGGGGDEGPKQRTAVEEIIKMDAFSRVSSEPDARSELARRYLAKVTIGATQTKDD